MMPLGTVKLPTVDTLREVATELGMTMSDAELGMHQKAFEYCIDAYNLIDRMPDEVPEVRYPRVPGRRPTAEENKYGAWYVKTAIEGAPSGKLKGKKIAVKDNICVAGVPMMNGASIMEGYMPDVDATVIQRILDAGGTIAGKTVCEY
jgi:amidase